MGKKKQLKPESPKSWRPVPEDKELLELLKAKMGVQNDSDVVRMGLRKLAEAEGLR